MKPEALLSEFRTDHALALVVWALIGLAQTVFLPTFAPAEWTIGFSLRTVLDMLWSGGVAFIAAFPLSDSLLRAKRYWSFVPITFGFVAALSLAKEYVVDPAFFASPIIPMAAYLSFGEGAAMTVFFLSVRLLVHRYRNDIRIAELERTKLDAELQYLKAQINPHFLFNALNNLYAHALRSAPETPTLVLKLADMLRYTTYDSADTEVPLEKELAFLADYVAIQDMALQGRGETRLRIQGKPEGRRIAPLLLIPFVENCFKHSLASVERDIVIDIAIDLKDNFLRMVCRNSYEPRDNEAPNPASGLGIANARRRLELLFDDEFEFGILQDAGWFEVKLEVPTTS